MKKLIVSTIVLSLFMVGTVNAQSLSKNKIPKAVVQKFQKSFPKAKDVEWEMKHNLYEVEFDVGRNDHEVWYDESGNVVKQKEDISKNGLPQAVKATLKKEFDGYSVHDVQKVTKKRKTIYKMELKNASKELDVSIDEQGKVLSKKAD